MTLFLGFFKKSQKDGFSDLCLTSIDSCDNNVAMSIACPKRLEESYGRNVIDTVADYKIKAMSELPNMKIAYNIRPVLNL